MISVIIPAYNEAQTIEPCITSILSQTKDTESSVEIVVCDDASTDETADIVDALATEYSAVTSIHNESNKGILETTQRCVDTATGDILFRIDADSTLRSDSLDALQNQFDSGVDLLYGKVHVSNTDKLHPAACQLGKEQGTAAWYGAACVATRREVITEIGGFDNMRQNIEKELMNYAATTDIHVLKTPEVAIDSRFPETVSEWLPRKYKSGRIYIKECADTPGKLEISQLRGPIAWSGIGLSALVSPLLSIVGFAAILALYAKRIPKLSSITKKPSVLGLYPFYMAVGGIARTIGVYRTLPLLAKTLWGKYD